MHYTLAELAEEAGLAARTIRFYIARGLLDGPVKSGRAAAYTEEHRKRLKKVQSLQNEGRTLLEIARLIETPAERSPAPEPSAWWRFDIADDLVVSARADASPWRAQQIRGALDDLARKLRTERRDHE